MSSTTSTTSPFTILAAGSALLAAGLFAATRHKRASSSSSAPARSSSPSLTRCCTRQVISGTYEFGSVRLREYGHVECQGAVVLEGFPSEGMVNILAANYLVEKLDLPLIGDIVSDDFPLTVAVVDGVPQHPVRIYGNAELVVITSQLKFEDESASTIARDLVRAMMDFCTRHKAGLLLTMEVLQMELDQEELDKLGRTREEILMAMASQMGADQEEDGDEDAQIDLSGLIPTGNPKLGRMTSNKRSKAKKKRKKKGSKGKDGADEDDDEPEPDMYYLTNTQWFVDRMETRNYAPLQEAMMTGLTAGVLAESAFSDVNIGCIIARSTSMLSDASAVVPMVECIDFVLGDRISIDLSGIEKQVAEIEAEVKKQIETITGGGVKRQNSNDLSMYM